MVSISNAIRVTTGRGFSCALLETGEVLCWGENRYSRLADGTTTPSSTPIPIVDIPSAVDVSAEGDHVCAASRGGAVHCWGRNHRGQLGDGTMIDQTMPATVMF